MAAGDEGRGSNWALAAVTDFAKALSSGGLASAIAKTAVAPFERVKLLLQTQTLVVGHRPYTNVLDAFVRIPREQGVLSFWRGNLMNVSRIVPSYALRFSLLDKYQKMAEYGLSPGAPLPLSRQMAAGALSGFTTVLVTFPLDLLRTQMSARLEAGAKVADLGYVATARDIVSREGVSGLYRGVTISSLEITPYVAISLGGYQWLKSKLPEDSPYGGMWMKLGGGWLTGITASLICYPIDTLKRHLMLQGTRGFEGSHFAVETAAAAAKATPFSPTTFSMIGVYAKGMYQEGGVRVFYRGCLLNAFKSAPAASLTFYLNDALRELVFSQK